MTKIDKPGLDETKIVGEWKLSNGKMVGNSNCIRIDFLTQEYFEKLGTDESGWNTLFRDPTDGRFWERTYEMSEMHGGGPPSLYNLSRESAENKYPHLFYSEFEVPRTS